jgi:hypothetical protein
MYSLETQIKIKEARKEQNRLLKEMKTAGKADAEELMILVQQVSASIAQLTKSTEKQAKSIVTSTNEQIRALKDNEVNEELLGTKKKAARTGAVIGEKIHNVKGFFTRNRAWAGVSGLFKGIKSRA